MVAKHRAGWEREAYYDSPGGATATTQLDHVVDVNINKAPEFVETTDRGTAGTIPKKTEQPVTRVVSITLVINYWDDNASGPDAQLSDLFAAEKNNVPVAFLSKAFNGGPTEFDGDCYVEWDSPGGLKDGMPVTFTVHPTHDLGRAWSDT